MSRFFRPSSRSPTGDLFRKRRPPLYLAQPHNGHQNYSRTNGLSLSTIDCPACVLRPSCESTIYINQGNLVLLPDMDACKMTPKPYITTIKPEPPLNQVFRNVPFDRLSFPSYSIGAARK